MVSALLESYGPTIGAMERPHDFAARTRWHFWAMKEESMRLVATAASTSELMASPETAERHFRLKAHQHEAYWWWRNQRTLSWSLRP